MSQFLQIDPSREPSRQRHADGVDERLGVFRVFRLPHAAVARRVRQSSSSPSSSSSSRAPFAVRVARASAIAFDRDAILDVQHPPKVWPLDVRARARAARRGVGGAKHARVTASAVSRRHARDRRAATDECRADANGREDDTLVTAARARATTEARDGTAGRRAMTRRTRARWRANALKRAIVALATGRAIGGASRRDAREDGD